jgi:hypothetical protein
VKAFAECPREWARLQGFPEEFVIAVSDASAYEQFRNFLAIPVIGAVGKIILKSLNMAADCLIKPAESLFQSVFMLQSTNKI